MTKKLSRYKAYSGFLLMQLSNSRIFLHTGGMPGINTPFHRVEIEKERDKFINVLDENGCIVVR